MYRDGSGGVQGACIGRKGYYVVIALLGLEKKPRSPKRIAAIVTACAVAAAGLGAGGYFAVTSYFGAGDEAGSVTYRRYTVERGDVVVGQSESSSISLDRETVTFPDIQGRADQSAIEDLARRG